MYENQIWLEKAISKYLTDKLAQFRTELEEGTDQSIEALQFNAALLLSDLCRFLNLNEEQHHHVLGERGTKHVSDVLGTRVSVPVAPLAPEPVRETVEQLTLPLIETDS